MADDFRQLPALSPDKSPDEILTDIDLSHLSAAHKMSALSILKKHMPVFAKSSLDVGKTSIAKAHFTLKQEATIQHQKYIPIPLAQKERVQKMLDDLHHAGVVTYQDTPSKVISNLICVRKPNTQVQQEKEGKGQTISTTSQAQDDLRLCLDLRLLNN